MGPNVERTRARGRQREDASIDIVEQSIFSVDRTWLSDEAINIFWFGGGLREALALVLALTLPDTVAERREIVIAAFAVVAFSIFVQGLTISIIRYLGLTHRAGQTQT